MRFCLTASLWAAASSIAAPVASAFGQHGNMQTCFGSTEEVDGTVDYFPAKVEPLSSKLWTVEYFSTYKVVRNLVTNTTYLLYQCGSAPPSDDEGYYDATIPVPVERAAIHQTPSIPNFEILGIMERIEYWMDRTDSISSQCLLDAINAGETTAFTTETIDEDLTLDAQEQEKISGTVIFLNQFTESPFEHEVYVDEYLEDGNAAVFEWLKYYSVFFNLEDVANEAYIAAERRHDCVKGTAGAVTADAPKPVVLWGYYSSYSEGWDVAADCTNKYNYYCEFADTCSATLLYSDEGSVAGWGTNMLMTTEEFVEFGKDAEHWIFPSFDWDTIYANFKDDLDNFTSVKLGQVYDVKGSGDNAWFEQRLGEYYDVAQDFCHVAGTTHALEGPNWFRNVFTEEVGSPGTCKEEVAGVFAYDGTCAGLEPITTGQDEQEKDEVDALVSAVPSFDPTVFPSSAIADNEDDSLVSAVPSFDPTLSPLSSIADSPNAAPSLEPKLSPNDTPSDEPSRCSSISAHGFGMMAMVFGLIFSL